LFDIFGKTAAIYPHFTLSCFNLTFNPLPFQSISTKIKGKTKTTSIITQTTAFHGVPTDKDLAIQSNEGFVVANMLYEL
jgi:hypothetical protein